MTMDILQEIIAIDKAAADRIEALRAEQASRLTDSGRAAADENEQLIAAESEKLEALRAQQEKQLREKQKSCAEAQSSEIQRLDSVFAANREKWLSDMLGRITGA